MQDKADRKDGQRRESATALTTSDGLPFAPKPGDVIKHYELIRRLGAGGMGVVFLARDTRLGRLVAIKFLLKHTGDATKRFLVEARMTAQCRHENIVVIYDVDEINGSPYMVLEYIGGRNLRAAMSDPTPDPAPRAISWMLAVARALSCAHAMGIIHRDLKPENILLSDSGQIKVLDFGVAKQFATDLGQTIPAERDAHSMQAIDITQDGAILGTMPYMSPEQLNGEPLDGRSDLFTAGLILLELATGKHPIRPFGYPQLRAVADLELPMPSAHEMLTAYRPLAELIDRCLQKRRDNRLASADELVEALEALSLGRPTVALAEDAGPYAGLAAFQEADAARFFGREADIALVVGRLRNLELVAVVGPSGAGKSSFVRAGVIPALKRASEHNEAFVVRPGRKPLTALADVLAFFLDSGTEAGREGVDPAEIARTLRNEPGYLGARLRARCRKRGPNHRILLVVDQLEEVFTLGAEPEERIAFFDCMEGVADDASSPLRVVTTIRSDFLDRLAAHRPLLAKVTRGLLVLPPLSVDGLRDALRKPLAALRYQFEDKELVEEMLAGLSGTSSPLPILQFTAAKLWEARDRGRRVLTRNAYLELGGVSGALSTHADAVIAGLSSFEQRLARAIFLRLVTPERARAIVHLEELCTLAEDAVQVEQVVHLLADARLVSVVAGDEREGKTVELTHESLIEGWRKLRQWLDENEKDASILVEIRNAASQWEKNGSADDFLWRDRAAADAGLWLERRKAEAGEQGLIGLSKRDIAYLEAVVRLAERTKRRRRLFALIIFADVTMALVTVALLWINARKEARRADEQAQLAEAQTKQARMEARDARNATRMALARERQDKDPTMVLALLREMEPGSSPRGWETLALWAREAGVAEWVKTAPGNVFCSAAYSPDGKRIVSGCADKTVRVWNLNGTGEPLVLRGHDAFVTSASFSPDGKRIVSTSFDKMVRVWNADGTGLPVVLTGHEEAVTGAMFSADGRRIVSVAMDKTARIWSADGTTQSIVLRGGDSLMSYAELSPDGQHVVSASFDKIVRVWNADGSGRPLELHGHEGAVSTAKFSPDGKRIVSASLDKTVRVWDADGTARPGETKAHAVEVTQASLSPDGTRIVAAFLDNVVRVWNADGTGDVLSLRGHEGVVASAAFRPDGSRILSVSYDKEVRVWDLNGAVKPIVLDVHEGDVRQAAFSPDSMRIVTASLDRTVRVWNADGSGAATLLGAHDGSVLAANWSPDGTRIVSASSDKTLRVWNADGTGRPVVLVGHADIVVFATFSPDGKRIASASYDNTIRIWNPDGTGAALVLRGHHRNLSCVAFSPDGSRLASASFDKTVRVWNADGSGTPTLLVGHGDAVLSVAWSPDGKSLVSASRDKTIRVWSVDGSRDPLVIEGHTGPVASASFSPDGKRIVSASRDRTVRIWNSDGTGEQFMLHTSSQHVNAASFSPDGKRVVAALENGKVMVWSHLEPLETPEDPRLWAPTTYCMPLEKRMRLLGFGEAQAARDLERCWTRVKEKAPMP